jgi:hypothetical protein
MNIFVTSKCPIECAKYLDNKRKVKMVLETAQMLSTAINENGGQATYKSTHKNHPSNIWLRKTKANYRWALRHFAALCREYTRIYGKTHKSSKLVKEFIDGYKLIPNGKLTPFANCAANNGLGISYKHIENVPKAYQLYLNDRWDNDKKEPTWS